MITIKSKFAFEISPWFETFFALQVLTDEDSRIHQDWKQQALARLPAAFHKKFAAIGGSPYLWPVIADTLLDLPLSLPFESRLSHLAQLPADDLK
ncbi:MAG TPA: hypothetical protein VJ521_08985, partial [Acidobacteriota bacterium]|nr:hypothetical protein [Acidobacteriota bacterium]